MNGLRLLQFISYSKSSDLASTESCHFYVKDIQSSDSNILIQHQTAWF